uniref:Uncharacterized protein n=1 Tax=Meloidogyne enterolobii TaxID=390850 RepID=A0A6V7TSJ6_MELEN|nr:unnamed protein product [Meloidogyne enterolobii]
MKAKKTFQIHHITYDGSKVSTELKWCQKLKFGRLCSKNYLENFPRLEVRRSKKLSSTRLKIRVAWV